MQTWEKVLGGFLVAFAAVFIVISTDYSMDMREVLFMGGCFLMLLVIFGLFNVLKWQKAKISQQLETLKKMKK